MEIDIVCLGGGTGTFTVLSGLKHHPVKLSAVVSIADNGGSTGILRDELGVLPPGDIRQCLVALASGDDVMRDLFTYRFADGSLSGHNFGNLFLSALEKLTGDPLKAVSEAHRILNVRGRVIPVAARSSNLFAELVDGVILEGETAIDQPQGTRPAIRRCFLSPRVKANPESLEAIKHADVIVIGPGDLYTSLVPVLLVDGIAEAIIASSAQCQYVVNLATRAGQTEGYTARNVCDAVNAYIAPGRIDVVILNSAAPPLEIVERYAEAGERVITDDLRDAPYAVWRGPLLSDEAVQREAGDRLRRSLLRHDPAKLANAVVAAARDGKQRRRRRLS